MLIIRTIMKREIKFRGQSIENRKNRQWIYGRYLSDYDGYSYRELIVDCITGLSYEVDPITIGQFSEITDKNGNSIFEHDLILIHDSESSYQFTVEVLFHKGMFCYKNKACGFTPLWYVSDRCEVIGNVFDNPELLKGSKQ